jgi:hypothetical protein
MIALVNSVILYFCLLQGKGAKKKMVTRDKFGDVDEDQSFFVWRQERKK